jgi:hypothetical protein
VRVVDHNAKGPADPLTALKELHELLSAHPRFKVVPVRVSPGAARKTSLLGLVIRRLRFRKFGAEFAGGLTLLRFRSRWETPSSLILELQWHATHISDGFSVFIHFVDASEEIRFQGDYTLEREAQDALGFFYSRRRVEVPKETPGGNYRVRLGVWRPAENRHVELLRFRGCLQEQAAWCHNAVIVDSVDKRDPPDMNSH